MLNRVVGWVLGAASLLNLLQDLDYVALKGKIGTWIAAYNAVVSNIHRLCFSWVNFKWVNISLQETHLLIISAIMATIVCRAHRQTIITTGKENETVTFAAVTIGSVLAPAVLLPGRLGILVGSLLLLGMLSVFVGLYLFGDGDGPQRLAIKPFFQELCGIGGIVLVLIAISNSLVFSTYG